MKTHRHFLPAVMLLACLLMIQGCARSIVARPGRITLEEAMSSVGRGLVQMKQQQIQANGGKEFKTGLVPSEAEVAFNISAAGTDSGKLYVEMSPIPTGGTPIEGKAGAEASSSYTAARGNQIVVKFRSILFGKTTTTKDAVIFEGAIAPEHAKKINDALEDQGYQIFSRPPKRDGALNSRPPLITVPVS